MCFRAAGGIRNKVYLWEGGFEHLFQRFHSPEIRAKKENSSLSCPWSSSDIVTLDSEQATLSVDETAAKFDWQETSFDVVVSIIASLHAFRTYSAYES